MVYRRLNKPENGHEKNDFHHVLSRRSCLVVVCNRNFNVIGNKPFLDFFCG